MIWTPLLCPSRGRTGRPPRRPGRGVVPVFELACRFRSERVPLFRASGDHLSGCGAIRLTMLRDRANSPAWLAPARWLRGVAIGGPRPKRCPVEHPRDVTVELLAQRDGSLEEAQPGRRGVQIQLITT